MLYATVVAFILILLIAGGGITHHVKKLKHKGNKPEPFYWQHYRRLDGYYNGIRTLVTPADYTPENGWNKTAPVALITTKEASKLPAAPPLDPVTFDPYPAYSSLEYLAKYEKVEQCFLDTAEKVPAPDVYVYPGLPQNMSVPFYGSYHELGLEDNVCFDRFGRLGPYGYGYNYSQGGLGPGNHSEHAGSEKIFSKTGIIDYSNVDWGNAQKACLDKNKARFRGASEQTQVKHVPRHAYVLRVWGDYFFNDHQIYSLRAMINELSLKSGGEYDVHFLLHVKNNSKPIWADKEVYQATIEENMPREFWNMTTLWSEAQMVNYYPGPFPQAFKNLAGSGIHGVYRSAHFPLQWFAQQHPEYDFYWNWEMDLRYTGHYYEFNTRIGEWARKQPRKGLWERSQRFYIPEFHGTWDNFTELVERETMESGKEPIWGPVEFPNSGRLDYSSYSQPPRSYAEDTYEWGVGEEADLIVFNPIFDPSATNWVFRDDITGFDLDKEEPPRRSAIITVARLSKRLLDLMHEETWKLHHTAFPEMWPPTLCFHHGLKAVYVPHPVYFDRDWDVEYMDKVFNHPQQPWESPFGWGEHNLLGSSFYYNSGFSGALWRRWLGQYENGEGGRKQEEKGTGRMCLRSSLHHPIKHELGPVD